jgi:hypothetical protein
MQGKFKFGMLLCVFLVAPLAVQAAECSSSVYLSLGAQARAIIAPARRCEVYARRHQNNIAGICNVCGPTFARGVQLDRYLTSHASCFKNEPKIRSAMRKFAKARYVLNFARRGCGY